MDSPFTRPATQVAAAAALVAVVVLLARTPTPAATTGALAIVLGSLVLALITRWFRRPESVLTAVVLLLFLVPQNYVLIGPLRSAGNPALLVGMVALGLWAAGRILGILVPIRNHPARWAVFFWLLASATAYAAAMMRPLAAPESAGTTRALFPLAASVGIAMLACDGLTRRRQIETVLQRLVLVGGVEAVIGIIEFTVHTFSYRSFARLPGLTYNTELINDTRAGFVRVLAAAAHPIEYTVALAALAPLALHFAIHARSRGYRRLSGLSFVAIVAVTPMSVSRSGIVCVAVGVGWYLVHLGWRARLNVLVLVLAGLGLMRAAVPGLLGTLFTLLFVGNQDPSIRSRTSDYAKIPALLNGHEIFGRGLGTFQPVQYFFLDNQYLGSLLEGGAIGLLALAGVFGVAMGLARGARHASVDRATRGLGQAISASVAALAVSASTFDMMSFRQTGLLMFLLLGCAGALWTAVRRVYVLPGPASEAIAADAPHGPDASDAPEAHPAASATAHRG